MSEAPQGVDREECSEWPHLTDPSPAGQRAPQSRLRFHHPHFAFNLHREHYWLSFTRGRDWYGPYATPTFGYQWTLGRTNYTLVNGRPWIFTSVVEQGELSQFVCAPEADPLNVARSLLMTTSQDELSLENVGEVGTRLHVAPACESPTDVPQLDNYSVMASLVRLRDGTVLAAARVRGGAERRLEIHRASPTTPTRWEHISVTAKDAFNPGSLVALGGQRVALFYGNRQSLRIEVTISEDAGRSWGAGIPLTEASRNNDIGYVRTAVRPDGKVVVVYYFTSCQLPEQHLRATIWDPRTESVVRVDRARVRLLAPEHLAASVL